LLISEGIHVPVRVEPKVALATERTFLSWLEFSIILGSIAAALINFTPPALGSNEPGPSPNFTSYYSTPPEGNPGFPLTMVSATAFTIIAIIALLYSLGLYLWRVDRISKRMSVNYHDWLGPSGLCLGLFGATLLSFGFRVWGWGKEVGFKG
jgi:uncharacterized membrane protein YidH (DUF202 family)